MSLDKSAVIHKKVIKEKQRVVMMENLIEMNIIFFFINDRFDEWIWRDRFASLIKYNKKIKIIGITYPVSILTLVCNPSRFIKSRLRSNSVNRLENMYSFTPISFLPMKIINCNYFLVKLHKFILHRQIKNHLKYIGIKGSIITWMNSIDAFPVFFDVFKNNLLVYDCIDEIVLKEDAVITRYEKIENELLAKANLVFTLSKYLYKTKKLKNSNCFYVSNGVDFDFFKQADFPETKIHEELKDIPKPIIGYLGNVRSWLDFDLLGFLADNLKEASFVFVGPISMDIIKSVKLLDKRSNTYFLGRKDRKVLPSILKGFDVCLIPFKLNKFNLATNPFKFWEYLASGKPILSLRILDLEPYEDVVSLYATKKEALYKMNKLLGADSPEFKRRRMDIAKCNDLSIRSKQYYEILAGYLNKKSPE